MISCKDNPLRKDYSQQIRGGTLSKPSNEENGKEVMDLENLHRVIKKLTNEIIDVKRNIREGSFMLEQESNFLEVAQF